ncbi:Uma2 family endonuclease [Romeria aff. gracilis LEGE 07310]|uniref:Uma2 family endonuclease n=1 Tax=Vasconcelosia minhoensis LEGE 07310 TaxID=915328 RepID=A0A8J7AK76_9CYAN|nr:Uma2 family endonuclease [Romeria gracilis]MBE9076740.1 Uma2 family endonuclease [Romeria aff. gracilis LEGE 07310]
MVQTPVRPVPLETFLSLPETEPASEYVDGRIIQKPMPQGKHSRLQLDFATVINSVVRPEKVACAFPELRCTFDGISIVPDIAVFIWSRIPTDSDGEIANVFPLAPDWTIEILSPGQRPTRVTKNILRCLRNGAEMGWLMDPEDRAVFVYRAGQEVEIVDEPEAVLPLPMFMAMEYRVEDLFGLLKL